MLNFIVFFIGFLLSKKIFLLLTKYICCCSVVSDSDPMDCSTPGFPPCLSVSPGVCSNSCPLSRCPLLLRPSIFPSIRVISNLSACLISWPQYWRFSFSISPSSEYSGLIFFRIDWFGIWMKTDFSRKYIIKDCEKWTLISPTCSEIVQGDTQIHTEGQEEKGIVKGKADRAKGKQLVNLGKSYGSFLYWYSRFV